MAPSSRRIAPSISTSLTTAATSIKSTRQSSGTQQPKSALSSDNNNNNNLSFGRVTKSRSTRLGLRVKFSDAEKGAFANWSEVDAQNERKGLNRNGVEVKQELNIENAVQEIEVQKISSEALCETLQHGSKRKRGGVSDCESESRSASEEEELGPRKISDLPARVQSKKRRVQSLGQLLSPPASRDGTDCDEILSLTGDVASSPRSRRKNAALASFVNLPQQLLDLISMHAAFLRALSLHYAHNGASSPAELGMLMDSMTRIWKKQSVRKNDMQRMLGLYEVSSNSTLFGSKQVERKFCPFKIVTSGLGTNVRTNLEYICQSSFGENVLQASYSDMVHNYFRDHPDIVDTTTLPILTITLGTQTSLHRAKAASTRAEILNLSTTAQSRSTPDFSKLSISDPLDHTPAAVKSRTSSLFDRVRAKALANSNISAPTSEQIARQHALGRISEVVEFLRMKQQQKLSTQFQSSVHDSPGKVRGIGKVSFSLGAIVKDIRQSVGVPIAENEVRICLRILSCELPGDWCRMIELGSVVSITLQGNGMSGVEVKRLLSENALNGR